MEMLHVRTTIHKHVEYAGAFQGTAYEQKNAYRMLLLSAHIQGTECVCEARPTNASKGPGILVGKHFQFLLRVATKNAA